METGNSNYETQIQQMAGEPCCASATAQKIMEQGTEALGQAEQLVSDAYEKTSKKVSETYEKAKIYGNENQGIIILIVLGIGMAMKYSCYDSYYLQYYVRDGQSGAWLFGPASTSAIQQVCSTSGCTACPTRHSTPRKIIESPRKGDSHGQRNFGR